MCALRLPGVPRINGMHLSAMVGNGKRRCGLHEAPPESPTADAQKLLRIDSSLAQNGSQCTLRNITGMIGDCRIPDLSLPKSGKAAHSSSNHDGEILTIGNGGQRGRAFALPRVVAECVRGWQFPSTAIVSPAHAASLLIPVNADGITGWAESRVARRSCGRDDCQSRHAAVLEPSRCSPDSRRSSDGCLLVSERIRGGADGPAVRAVSPWSGSRVN